MKKLFLFIPAFLLLSIACQKEETSPSSNENGQESSMKMITETVSGSRDDSTKATDWEYQPDFCLDGRGQRGSTRFQWR